MREQPDRVRGAVSTGLVVALLVLLASGLFAAAWLLRDPAPKKAGNGDASLRGASVPEADPKGAAALGQPAAPRRGEAEAPGAASLSSKATGLDPLDADTRVAYRREAARLGLLRTQHPGDALLAQRLMAVLLLYRERFPMDFDDHPKAGVTLGELRRASAAIKPAGASSDVRALDMVAKGSWDQASRLMEIRLRRAPKDFDARYLLGKALLGQHQAKKASQVFSLLVQQHEDDARARYFLGVSRLREGLINPAEEAFQQALALSPHHLDARLGLARLELRRRRPWAARRAAEEVLLAAAKVKARGAQREAHLLLADGCPRRRDLAGCVKHFTEAMEIRTDEATILALAESHLALGQAREALRVLQRCNEVRCGAERYYLTIAKQRMAAGKPQEVLQWIARGLEAYPRSADLRLLKAEQAERAAAPDLAVAVYRKITLGAPADPRAWLRLAALLDKRGQPEEAQKVLEDGVKKAQPARKLVLHLAAQHRRRGDFERERKALAELVRQRPDDAGARVALARWYSRRARHGEAIKQLEELERHGPLDGVTTTAFVDLLVRAGRTKDAAERAERFVKDHPGDPAANALMGQLHLAQGQPAMASGALKKAVAARPNDPRLQRMLAMSLAGAGKSEEATRGFRRAVEMDPHDPETRLAFARFLAGLEGEGSHREAVTHLTFLIEELEKGRLDLSGDIAASLYELRGQLRFDAEAFDAALLDFKRLAQLDAGSRDGILDRAAELNQGGHVPLAETWLQALLEIDPQNPGGNLLLGQINLRRGRRKTAETYLKRVVKRAGRKHPTAYRDLGYIYHRRGLQNLADAYFRKYLNYSPTMPEDAARVRSLLRESGGSTPGRD